MEHKHYQAKTLTLGGMTYRVAVSPTPPAIQMQRWRINSSGLGSITYVFLIYLILR